MLLDAKEKCCGCGACANICPKGCIAMAADEEGFLYPQVDEAVCVQCGLCKSVCPVLQGTVEQDTDGPRAFAAYNKDEQIRAASSSGGVFTLLAQQVLSDGGVVFGAAMSADQRTVRHIMVDGMEGLAALRGSKYVQSQMGACYTQAKEALEAGKAVLFSGTPCQIEGLRGFLKKDDPKLLCVDLICHGAPSPKVWDAYVRHQEARAGSKVKRVFFRDKRRGWKYFSMALEFENGKVYSKDLEKDLFMEVFLKDLCLRPSCYGCAFKKLHRVSDLTLADFWGCRKVCPELNDDRGLSLVLAHSKKGEAALERAKAQMVVREVDRSAALSNNPSMVCSVERPAGRDAFMGEAAQEPERWKAYLPKQPLKQKARALAVRQVVRARHLLRK